MKQISFEPNQNMLLRAGAGAGKTTTLIRLFFESVEHYRVARNRWPKIILTTFTRKATQEIRERLFKEALRRGDQDLFEFLQSRYHVQISTIHGVLSLFLSRFGDSLGLPKDYKMVDEQVLLRQEKNVLKGVLENHPEHLGLLEEFNFSEILTLMKAMAEQASTGSLIRYTAGQLEGDLRAELQEVQRLWQDLRAQAELEPLTPAWQGFLEHFGFLGQTLIGLEERIDQIRRFLEDKPNKPRYVSGKTSITEVFNEKVQTLLETLKNLSEKRLNVFFQRDRMEVTTLELESLFEIYRPAWLEHQMAQGILSMQDLELVTSEVLRRDPEAGQEFSKDWDFWMIDEYQDTSPRQDFLLKSLRSEKSEFVVGDPQQSIYLFRGSRTEIFEKKQASMETVTKQLINYRSRKEVLDFINDYFGKLSDQFEPMEVGSQVSRPEDPACVVYPAFEAGDWMGQAVVARIDELVNQGVRPEDICVLSRNHRNLKDLETALQLVQIPFYHHSAGQFFKRREIQDALQILRFLDNPHDNINLVGLLRSPWFYKSDEEIQNVCHGPSYWKWIQKNRPQDSIFKELSKYLILSEVLGDLACFKKILVERGFIHTSFSIDPTGQREANLWKLVQLCEAEQAQGEFQIAEFLDRVQGVGPDSGAEEVETSAVVEPSRVQLMTIHASKGLQFPHVIITGFGDGSPPSKLDLFNYDEATELWSVSLKDLETGSSMMTPLAHRVREEQKRREQEESLRLLYVAMTRAQESLTLVWSKPRPQSWASLCPLEVLEEGRQKMTPSGNGRTQSLASYEIEVRKNFVPTEARDKVSVQSLEVRAPWFTKIPEKAPARVSVSVTSLLEGLKPSPGLSGSQQKYRVPNLEKSKRGQKAHRVFEALKYNMDLSSIFKEDPSLKAATEYILSLESPPFQELLPVGEVEWGFSVDWEGQKLSGQIDFWALKDNQLWVIDYKTGSPESAPKALQQLAIYAECLFKTARAPRTAEVHLAAIYPMDQKVFLQRSESF